jgi:hypothetical protein
MLFSSNVFLLVFLTITLGLYYALARGRKARIALLIAVDRGVAETPRSRRTASAMAL